jgi:hypothetical protein
MNEEQWEATYGGMEQEDVDAELLRQGIMSPKDFYAQAKAMGAEATTTGYLAYAQAAMAGHEEALQEPRLLPEPKGIRVDFVRGATKFLRSLVDKKNGQRVEAVPPPEPEVNVLPPSNDIYLMPGEVPEKEEAVSVREVLVEAKNKRRFVRMDYTRKGDNVRTRGRCELILAVTQSYAVTFSWTRYPQILAQLVSTAIRREKRLLSEAELQELETAARYKARRTLLIDRVEDPEILDWAVSPRQEREDQVLLVPVDDSVAHQKMKWAPTNVADKWLETGRWEKAA